MSNRRDFLKTAAFAALGSGMAINHVFAGGNDAPSLFNVNSRAGVTPKMKLRFFTNISHEFRTPLTLIIGQVEMLLQMEKLAPVVNKRLRGIHKNAVNLRLLITELLDFRKQEQGFMKLKVERVDVISFVKDIYQLFVDFARKRNMEYTFEHVEEEVDLWFDPVQMQKVIFNLLSNAFKYTPEGKDIKVTVRRQQRMIEIAVIFHYVRIAVSVYISRTAQQVTGVNRNLHPDRMQIIFHHLIKFPVNKNSKLHIICISCRAVHSFP